MENNGRISLVLQHILALAALRGLYELLQDFLKYLPALTGLLTW